MRVRNVVLNSQYYWAFWWLGELNMLRQSRSTGPFVSFDPTVGWPKVQTLPTLTTFIPPTFTLSADSLLQTETPNPTTISQQTAPHLPSPTTKPHFLTHCRSYLTQLRRIPPPHYTSTQISEHPARKSQSYAASA